MKRELQAECGPGPVFCIQLRSHGISRHDTCGIPEHHKPVPPPVCGVANAGFTNQSAQGPPTCGCPEAMQSGGSAVWCISMPACSSGGLSRRPGVLVVSGVAVADVLARHCRAAGVVVSLVVAMQPPAVSVVVAVPP